MEFSHKSVLFDECINALNIKPDGIYVDGTAGGAGHSLGVAKKLTSGRLFALDRDPDAVAVATERLKGYPATVVESNFKDMSAVLAERGVYSVDGILLDLGVSSYQLDNGERGFSYHKDAALDMRMSRSGITAAELINNLSVDELARIFRDYGEEKFAFRIAERIVNQRQTSPIETTSQLSDIISSAYPAAKRRDGHPARKCFQALRIAVNGELDALAEALDKAFDILAPDGVLAIITFHSLEDRMVKQKFKEYTIGCTCPPDFPVCVCGNQPKIKIITKKPILPSDEELAVNSRSKSAKLRVAEKI